MKTLIIFALLSTVIYGVKSHSTEVSNYYINGIRTSLDQAINSALHISLEVRVGQIRNLYNSTHGTGSDLLESANQTFDWNDFYNQDGDVDLENESQKVIRKYLSHPEITREKTVVVSKYASEFKSILQGNGDINEYFKKINRIINNYSSGGSFINEHRLMSSINHQIVSFDKLIAAIGSHYFNSELTYFAPTSVEILDINKMLSTLNAPTNDNKGINIIAHSQGNLFANRLLDAFNQPDRVKLLSVATPDEKVYGEETGKGYITLREDLVANAFIGEVPKNATHYPESFWAKYNISYPINFFNVAYNKITEIKDVRSRNIDVYGDLWGHDLSKVYLHIDTNGDSLSKKFIVESYRDNHDILASTLNHTVGCCGTGGSDGITEELEKLKFNDYSTSNMSLSESIVARGEEFSVYVTQSYSGTQTDSELSSARVGYFCSDDNKWDDGDYYLDYDISSLGSDDLSHDERETLTIPSGECNTGYILAVANYDNRIDESDKSNNVSYTPITITGGSVGNQPNDYSTSNIRLSKSTVERGEEFSVYVTQSYSGSKTDGELPSSYVGYFCSDDKKWDNKDHYLDRDSSSLGSDDLSHNERETLTIPPSECKTGYILAVANYNDRIDEDDKSNNVSYTPITIKDGSNSGDQGDVYISSESVSEPVLNAGGRYKFYARQYYRGNVKDSSLDNPKLEYYLSKDTKLSSDDEYLGRDYSSIGSDDKYDTESFYWTVPNNPDVGLFYILFVADADDDIKENNESNNVEYVQIVITDL